MLGCTSCGSGDSFSVRIGGSGLRHREGLEPSASYPCLSSSAAVRGRRLRWSAAPAQCRTLRPLLQQLGGCGATPRGRELGGSGVLRGQDLRDRGCWPGRCQHQQGGHGQVAGSLLCAGHSVGTFMSSSVFSQQP